jgi:hypothetical protein
MWRIARGGFYFVILGLGVSPAMLARVARAGGFFATAGVPVPVGVIGDMGLRSPPRDMVARRRLG